MAPRQNTITWLAPMGPAVQRQLLNLEFRGHDLPETWSIADVDSEDWPNADTFTLCRLSGGNVVVVVPLEHKRFRVVSNTGDALAALPLKMNATNIRRAGQFKISIRQVAKYSVGRVFLAGDAAHCHSPVGGRGMNLGIADGAELARRMVAGELDGYGDARHKVGEQVIAGSEAVRKVMTSAIRSRGAWFMPCCEPRPSCRRCNGCSPRKSYTVDLRISAGLGWRGLA